MCRRLRRIRLRRHKCYVISAAFDANQVCRREILHDAIALNGLERSHGHTRRRLRHRDAPLACLLHTTVMLLQFPYKSMGRTYRQEVSTSPWSSLQDETAGRM